MGPLTIYYHNSQYRERENGQSWGHHIGEYLCVKVPGFTVLSINQGSYWSLFLTRIEMEALMKRRLWIRESPSYKGALVPQHWKSTMFVIYTCPTISPILTLPLLLRVDGSKIKKDFSHLCTPLESVDCEFTTGCSQSRFWKCLKIGTHYTSLQQLY